MRNMEFHASDLEERQNIPDAFIKYIIIPSIWKQDMKMMKLSKFVKIAC